MTAVFRIFVEHFQERFDTVSFLHLVTKSSFYITSHGLDHRFQACGALEFFQGPHDFVLFTVNRAPAVSTWFTRYPLLLLLW